MFRSILIPLMLGVIATPLPSYLPPQVFPLHGGGGGTSFNRSCGSGKVVTGFHGREGMVVDAIGVLCRPVNANGTLGSESAVGPPAGGTGGTSTAMSCPSGTVAWSARIIAGSFVNAVSLFCKRWDPATRKFTTLVNVVPGIGYHAGGTVVDQKCEQATQPMNGFRGRAAGVVDAIGIICDEP